MDIELETPQVINFFPTAGNFLSIIAVKSTTCITVLHWHGARHPELTEAIVGIWNKHPGYLDVHWAFFVLIFFFSVCGVVWWWLGRYKEPNGDWSIQFVEIVIAWFLMCQEILWKTNDTFLMRDGQSFDTFHIPHKLHWCQIQNMQACIRHASTFFKSFVYKVHASLCIPQSLRN